MRLCIFAGKRHAAMKYHIHEDTEPHCLECGDLVPYGGRPDRRFCCPQCKNRWHNRKARARRHGQLKVVNILEQNYSILERLLRMGIKSIEKADLAHLGYNFDYVTSYHKVHRRNEYHCFDIKYDDTPSRIMHIRLLPVLPVEETGENE